MAKSNSETTTKFNVDISELKSAMQTAKRQVAIANSEFKAISATMDDWTKSTEGISAKLEQLDSNLRNQKTVLSNLERQYELTVAEMGEGSKAADDLKIKINNQKAVVTQTEREISKYQDTLEEVAEAEETAAKTGKSVAEVLEDVGDNAEEAGDGFTVLKGAVATFAGNALTSLAGGIRDAASNLLGLADETREYRTELGKLETAFDTAGFSTEAATKTYKDLYAVLGDEGQAVEAANHLAMLADTEAELAEWTNIATGVYATFGASLPIEGLAEAANETAKTGALTGGLTDALNWAGVSEDAFQKSLDKCNTEQERQALITDTLNGLYTDAAKKYEETNKSVMDANRANSDYTDTMAAMGEKIEPVTTTLKEGFNGLLQELFKLVEDVDMEAFTSKIEEGFSILKNEVLPAVKEGFGWIIENKDTLIAGLAGIAAGFLGFKVATLIQGVTSAMQGMTIAQYALNLAMSLNPIGLAVAAIVGLVAAFVVLWNKSDTFRNFWIGLWENIKAFCSKAIDSIVGFFTETIPTAIDNMVVFLKELPTKFWTWLLATINKVKQWRADTIAKAKEAGSGFVSNIIDFVKQLPSKFWTWLLNTINKVKEWRSNMINNAKDAASQFISNVVSYVSQLPAKLWTWLLNTVSKVVSFGSDLRAKGKEAAQGLMNSIIDIAKGIPDKMRSVGSDVIGGLWSGISGAIGGLYDNIKSSLSGLVDKAKNALGIHSPSKVFAEEVGKWIPEGIAVGIDKHAKSVLQSVKGLSTEMVMGARNGLQGTSAGLVSSSTTAGGVVNNFYQTNNSPKALSRLDIYRQSKNLLNYAGGVS